MTDKQLWRLWLCINELQAYLGNQIEAGAKGADKDDKEASRCKKLIQREREKLKSNIKGEGEQKEEQ